MHVTALVEQVKKIVTQNNMGREEKLLQICQLLRKNIPYYDWVGFYLRNGDKQELVLGPYDGAATDHTIIPFGKGICGQVALSDNTYIVPDVTQENNYLACSTTVKSEIVVPLFVEGKNIGQIDIDSETLAAFGPEDEQLLTEINKLVAQLF